MLLDSGAGQGRAARIGNIRPSFYVRWRNHFAIQVIRAVIFLPAHAQGIAFCVGFADLLGGERRIHQVIAAGVGAIPFVEIRIGIEVGLVLGIEPAERGTPVRRLRRDQQARFQVMGAAKAKVLVADLEIRTLTRGILARIPVEVGHCAGVGQESNANGWDFQRRSDRERAISSLGVEDHQRDGGSPIALADGSGGGLTVVNGEWQPRLYAKRRVGDRRPGLAAQRQGDIVDDANGAIRSGSLADAHVPAHILWADQKCLMNNKFCARVLLVEGEGVAVAVFRLLQVRDFAGIGYVSEYAIAQFVIEGQSSNALADSERQTAVSIRVGGGIGQRLVAVVLMADLVDKMVDDAGRFIDR